MLVVSDAPAHGEQLDYLDSLFLVLPSSLNLPNYPNCRPLSRDVGPLRLSLRSPEMLPP